MLSDVNLEAVFRKPGMSHHPDQPDPLVGISFSSKKVSEIYIGFKKR